MRWLCIGLVWLAAAVTVGAQDGGDLVHTVAAGETLISIANAYGVSLDELLALNELDPNAILPIGRQLVVILEADLVADAEEASDDRETAEATAVPISTTSVAGLPPAPIAAADAPMLDPALISPRLCFAVFADANQNGMREPGEGYLNGATIRLLDEDGVEALQYQSDGQSEPHCPPDLPGRRYAIEAMAPSGYGLTGAARLSLDLRDGGDVEIDYGAWPGFDAAAVPPLQPVAQDETPAEASQPAILRELSGLFVLLLAGLVFCSGMALSIVLRFR